jgi:hypothetical protein
VVLVSGASVMTLLVEPVFHTKLKAPLALSVTDDPKHTAVDEGAIVTTGPGVTARLMVASFGQLPVVPVTVYTVVVIAVTVAGFVVLPKFHE